MVAHLNLTVTETKFKAKQTDLNQLFFRINSLFGLQGAPK